VGRSRMLDQEFGETTLRVLRETVLAHATAAGMPEGRALDVMLAVHELAANAVKHGGGIGSLRMSVTNRELICQVSDPGSASSGLPVAAHRAASFLARLPRDRRGRMRPATGCGSSARSPTI
jgi:anti-sigma regulatory factor (Ser/Thr protein kinase)